jgi:DNA-3-methyladenine glycosylase II
MQLSCQIALPTSFRTNDILDFHRRDAQEIAERVTDTTLHKGMVWHDTPACLFVHFHSDQAEATLHVDGHVKPEHARDVEPMVRRMLGLAQRIDTFEDQYRSHPQLGKLIAQHPGLRAPVAATPFEALTWAITGQQISVNAAMSIRRKLIIATDIIHPEGLLCHPQARQILQLSEDQLRMAGFSTTKAKTLLTLSALVVDDQLPLDAWTQTLPVESIRAKLEAVHGIGPWTVNYALLRGYGWLDGSLHGDAAVRRGLKSLLAAPDKISAEETQNWLAQFSPWRALVAAHLWAAQSFTA